MRITRRLGVLVAVPLAAVSGFGAIALTASAGETMRGEHLWSLMNTSTAAGELICELQDERTMMALLLTDPDPRPDADVQTQIDQTDAAIEAYRMRVRALPHTPQVTRELLARIDDELTQLSTLRGQIRAGSAPALSSVVFQYRIAIADLAQFRDTVTTAGSAPQQIAGPIHAANLLYQASEATGQEESEVLRSAVGLPLTPAAVASIARDRQTYGEAMEAFDIQAPQDWRERPDEAMTSPDIQTAQQLEDQVGRLGASDTLRLDRAAWARSMSARRDALDSVREEMDLTTLSAIAQLRDHARRTAEAEAAAIAGTALLVVMVSLRLGRPMIRGLRQLRDAAHAVAFERLPAAVQELRASDSLTGRTPEEFADQAGDALMLGGRGSVAHSGRRAFLPGGRDPIRPDDAKDELAAVARAFNEVHREALRTAAEQVLLRAGVGATFVALARRGERLTGALTSELDRAERTEQDPDRLARLFVLDHLAARMTRNNESLLVIGGEGTARVRDRGVPVLDVVRAALGRIERYTRVDLETVEAGIVVAPQAVDHLVHLCAELLDNATAFSAPDSRVTVEARRMTDRVIIQIADRGIGMTPARRAELNTRLAAPRAVDSETVRAMGLTVVAHLAAWYGIEVELRGRPGGGTVAEVALPLTTLVPQEAVGPEEAEIAQPAAAYTELAERLSELSEDAKPRADIAAAAAAAVNAAGAPAAGSATTPNTDSAASAQSAAARAAANPATVADSARAGRAHAQHAAIENTAATGPAAPTAAENVRSGRVGAQPDAPATVADYAAPTEAGAQPPAWATAAEAAANRTPAQPASATTAEPAANQTTDKLPADGTPTTLNGLPVRVPQTKLPPAARRGSAPATRPDPDPETSKAPADRDPERVAATMAAYARGLTGRSGGPKP